MNVSPNNPMPPRDGAREEGPDLDLSQSGCWTLFAADPKYETNLFLQFKDAATSFRYQSERFCRYFMPIKCYIATVGTLWCMFGLFSSLASWKSLLLTLPCLVAAFFTTNPAFSHWIPRLLCLIPEFFLDQLLSNLFSEQSRTLYLLLVHSTNLMIGRIPERNLKLLIDTVLAYELPAHFAIRVSQLLLRAALNPPAFLGIVYDFFATTISIAVFATIVRADKSAWVLFDSFRSAEKAYMNMIDNNPFAAFVVSAKGRVLYCNLAGWQLAVGNRKGSLRRNRLMFCDLVHTEYKVPALEAIRLTCFRFMYNLKEMLLRVDHEKQRGKDNPVDQQHGGGGGNLPANLPTVKAKAEGTGSIVTS